MKEEWGVGGGARNGKWGTCGGGLEEFLFHKGWPFHSDHLFSHGEKPHCWYPGIALHVFVLEGHSILHLIHADL